MGYIRQHFITGFIFARKNHTVFKLLKDGVLKELRLSSRYVKEEVLSVTFDCESEIIAFTNRETLSRCRVFRDPPFKKPRLAHITDGVNNKDYLTVIRSLFKHLG